MLPLLINHRRADVEKKQRSVQLIMYAAHTYFCIQIAIWAGFILTYSNWNDRILMTRVAEFDAVNKLVPALLLIISITIFRLKLSCNRNQRFFAREKIILVHVTIFLLFVLVYAINLISYSRSQATLNDSFQKCHFKLEARIL